MSIKVTKTVYKVNDFLSWQRSESLVLSPSFQRRPVWSKPAKSFLIDTVVKDLPMPIIFLREQTNLETLEPIREVVDGQQRLRTLISFIEPNTLKDFNELRDIFFVEKLHNSEIANQSFRQLSQDVRKQILNYEFSVHILPSDTEDREVLQIFARMNATGIKLNSQELRNAEYYGSFKNVAYNLAYEQLTRWRNWKIFGEGDIARMLEVEETSDLIMLMFDGLHAKDQKRLGKLYARYEEQFPQADEVVRRFRTTMDEIEKGFGDKIKTSVFSKKTLFNTLFTFYYDLMYGINSTLEKRKPNELPKNLITAIQNASETIQSGEIEEEFAKFLRGATDVLKSRTIRFDFLKNNLAHA